MRGASRVTDKEALHWKELYESGMTYEEIALEVGRSRGTVRTHILRVGGVSRKGRTTKTNYTRMKDGVKSKPEPKFAQHHGNRRHHRRRSGW